MKDINNLCTYNVWSGTDYSNDLTGYTLGQMEAYSQEEYSITGERSLKAKSKINTYNAINLSTINVNEGDTLTGKIQVYHPQGGQINLRLSWSGGIISSDFNISNKTQSISISNEFTEEKSVNFILVLRSDTDLVYLDNIKLVKS